MLSQLVGRHQLVQRINIAQVVGRIDNFSQRVDYWVGDAQNEDIFDQPILTIDILLYKIASDDGYEDRVDELRKYALYGQTYLIIRHRVVPLIWSQKLYHFYINIQLRPIIRFIIAIDSDIIVERIWLLSLRALADDREYVITNEMAKMVAEME